MRQAREKIKCGTYLRFHQKDGGKENWKKSAAKGRELVDENIEILFAITAKQGER